MARNLKILEIEGQEYIWDERKAKMILSDYVRRKKKTKYSEYDEISDLCNVSPDAVKNWFLGKNGPGESEYVIKMATHFETDYQNLVTIYISEVKIMEELLDNIVFNAINLNGMVQFIGMINRLAMDTVGGYVGFSEFVEHHKDYVNGEKPYPGVIYIDEEGPDYGKIVADMCVDDYHDDIISTYDKLLERYSLDKYTLVVRDEDEEPFIELIGDQLCIVIDNGKWYSC